jgi:hypothetical protein
MIWYFDVSKLHSLGEFRSVTELAVLLLSLIGYFIGTYEGDLCLLA